MLVKGDFNPLCASLRLPCEDVTDGMEDIEDVAASVVGPMCPSTLPVKPREPGTDDDVLLVATIDEGPVERVGDPGRSTDEMPFELPALSGEGPLTPGPPAIPSPTFPLPLVPVDDLPFVPVLLLLLRPKSARLLGTLDVVVDDLVCDPGERRDD